jgi:Mn2+/Fe2+ NRAMP family transporter
MELLHVGKWISVPVAGVMVWLLVVLGNYRRLEKIFVFASFLYLAYILTGVLAHPDWSAAAKATVALPPISRWHDSNYLYLAVGLIGATIAPWQQFYLQASIVDKGASDRNLRFAQMDAIAGSLFSVVIAGFIVVACAATLFVHGYHEIHDAADAARSLRPLGGEYAFILFSVGLLNASLFAASVLPLSTAYTVCEGLGVESGLNKRFREAPVFYWLYTLMLVAGAGLVLMPRFPLVKIAVFSQVLNGVLLPFVLIFMLFLINKKEVMGAYRNSRRYNVLAWSLTALIIGLTVMMLISQIRG